VVLGPCTVTDAKPVWSVARDNRGDCRRACEVDLIGALHNRIRRQVGPMNAVPPVVGGLARLGKQGSIEPLAQLAAKVACALLMARIETDGRGLVARLPRAQQARDREWPR